MYNRSTAQIRYLCSGRDITKSEVRGQKDQVKAVGDVDLETVAPTLTSFCQNSFFLVRFIL